MVPSQLSAADRQRLLDKIMALDLGPIKVKLMAPDGDAWDRQQVDRVETVYKRFLFLAVTEKVQIVPTQEVDTFWHRHILDTRKYAEDCEHLFGFFLHHFPYFGMRGEEDQKTLQDSFASTCDIYERLFGTPYFEGVGANCGGCGTDCGGQNCARDINDIRFKTMRPDLRPSLAT
jgi:hypothetical protein